MDLHGKLTALAETMSDKERAELKLLLRMAAGGLAKDGRPPEQGVEALAFSATLAFIARLQPHRDRVPPSGIVYRGRPAFLADELLQRLKEESAALRSTAVRFDDHLVASGAPFASQIASSPELRGLLEAHTERFVPTMKADYLYYDWPGFGLDPHVDNEEFALNAILMLEHIYEDEPSALVLYPPGSPPERILLAPGEFIVLYADSIAHARERMKQNERVSIVAFGFQPS